MVKHFERRQLLLSHDPLFHGAFEMTSPREIQQNVYAQFRNGQRGPLKNVLRLITDWSVMKEAWRTVASRSGKNTAGADGVTLAAVRANPRGAAGFLNELADRLQNGRYRPGKVRRFEIAKSNGKTRPLAVLDLADRVVHTALKLVLEPALEARLGKQCYGFRPGRSRYDELYDIRQQVQLVPEIYKVALTTDIAACFDTIDHGVIRNELTSLIDDQDALSLIESVLKQVGSGVQGWLKKRHVGVLQGSAFSPLLANLALSRFDAEWRHRQGERHKAFRYADDLVVLAESQRDAIKLRRELADCLRLTTRMKLEPSKTKITPFQDGVRLLGMQIRQHTDPFDGREVVNIYVDPDRIKDVLGEVDEWSESMTDERSVSRCFDKLNQRLQGWFATYQYAYDAPQAFSTIDYHVFRTIRLRLRAILKSSAAEVQSLYHTYEKSGHESWTAEGVTVLVLGSLPRKQYRRTKRVLPWDRQVTNDAETATKPLAGTSGATAAAALIPVAGVSPMPHRPELPQLRRAMAAAEHLDL